MTKDQQQKENIQRFAGGEDLSSNVTDHQYFEEHGDTTHPHEVVANLFGAGSATATRKQLFGSSHMHKEGERQNKENVGVFRNLTEELDGNDDTDEHIENSMGNNAMVV